MAEVTVRARGLAQFQRDLRAADRDARKRVDARLAEEAGKVVAEAKSIVIAKGLVKTGALLGGIKPFVRIGIVGVASTARNKGYPYPRRLEYEHREPGGYGPRASLNPAVDRKTNEIVNSLDDVIGDLYEKVF